MTLYMLIDKIILFSVVEGGGVVVTYMFINYRKFVIELAHKMWEGN